MNVFLILICVGLRVFVRIFLEVLFVNVSGDFYLIKLVLVVKMWMSVRVIIVVSMVVRILLGVIGVVVFRVIFSIISGISVLMKMNVLVFIFVEEFFVIIFWGVISVCVLLVFSMNSLVEDVKILMNVVFCRFFVVMVVLILRVVICVVVYLVIFVQVKGIVFLEWVWVEEIQSYLLVVKWMIIYFFQRFVMSVRLMVILNGVGNGEV